VSVRGSRFACLLCALVTAGAAPAAAQVVTVPMHEVSSAPDRDAPLPARAVTLEEAVEATMRRAPAIAASAANVRAASGRLQQNTGIFDTTLLVAPSVGYSQEPVPPGLRKSELDKRLVIRNIANTFTVLTQALRNLVAGLGNQRLECPPNLGLNTDPLIFDRIDPVESSQFGFARTLRPAVIIELDRFIRSVNLGDICTTDIEPRLQADLLQRYLGTIDFSGNQGLQGVLTSVSQIPRETRALQAQITDAVATRALLALDRLGPVPDDLLRSNVQLAVSVFKPFRNGATLSGDVLLSSEETRYRDKPLDPTFGGIGLPPRFPSEVSATFTLPLGRGAGRMAVTAPERAAEFTLAASREELRHRIGEEVLRTVLAYTNLVAAQETVRLLEDSQARQARIAELTGNQVEAGELPAMEQERARARAASVAQSIGQARTRVIDARVALAQAMGLDVADLDAMPLATERLGPAVAPPPQAGALMALGTERRRDVRGLQRAREASGVLAEGARLNVRQRYDLSVTGGYSNLYESPLFRYLGDEQGPIISQLGTPGPRVDPAYRYYSPRGFWRSVSNRWEPFVTASITVGLSFRNNTARGQLQQARATMARADIELLRLERTIGENLLATTTALQRTVEAVEQQRSAVTHGEQLLNGVLEQFQVAEATVFDTLLTEEEVTQDRLELVRQLQAYAAGMARLRFESGDLVTFENEGTDMETARADLQGLVER
jgi:outer membrane protein TolC